MNPNNERDMKRLWDALAYSRDKLRPFRENRLNAIRQYVGSHYGNNGSQEDVPVNFLELAISIYTQQLVGAPPRAYVATKRQELRPAAVHLKLALDYTIERIALERTLWRVVQEAMFCQGICKVGTAEASPHELGNWWSQEGEPFCTWIDMDDWVQDMTAKTNEAMAFMGNRYRMPLEEAKQSSAFDKKQREKLQRTERYTTSEDGDTKAETLSGGLDVQQDEYEDEVELWELWLPRQKQLVTLPAHNDKAKPLRIIQWEGPHEGPFPLLGFSVVPSNAMPLPPVAIWQDLHDLANQLYLKLGRQALRQKSILPFRGGTEDDVERIRDSSDGDILRVDGEIPKEVAYGAPSQVNLAFFLGINELFNRHAGNLDVLGGLSAQAETLGQEELMSSSASQRMVFMRRQLGYFVDSIMTRLAHYLYSDPMVSLDVTREVGKTGREIPLPWNANTRAGRPELFQIAIEPYSMIYRNPQSQIRQLMEVWQNVVMPAAPLLPPANLVSATEALLKMIADKADLPELSELIPYLMVSEEAEQGPAGGGAGQPSETTRNYVRKNIPGGSRSQKENALAQALLGSMPQPAEAATTMRGTA